MTSQQIAQEALEIYQANKREPRDRAEALLDQYFRFASQWEYEQIMDRVAVAVTSEESCVHPGTTSF